MGRRKQKMHRGCGGHREQVSVRAAAAAGWVIPPPSARRQLGAHAALPAARVGLPHARSSPHGNKGRGGKLRTGAAGSTGRPQVPEPERDGSGQCPQPRARRPRPPPVRIVGPAEPGLRGGVGRKGIKYGARLPPAGVRRGSAPTETPLVRRRSPSSLHLSYKMSISKADKTQGDGERSGERASESQGERARESERASERERERRESILL